MNYRIAICDDELDDIRRLTEMADTWACNSGHSVTVQTFESAEAFLFDCGGDNLFDILLLDVEMHTVSGIDLAKRIRRTERRAEIIFVTSHYEFIGEGYEVDALHYLMKPVAENKLSEVLSRAAEHLSAEPAAIIVSHKGETIKLSEDKIEYVEAFSHYISIRTKTGEYKVKESISSFASKLSGGFFRIHRSYIVSLGAIVRISRRTVIIEDGSELSGGELQK